VNPVAMTFARFTAKNIVKQDWLDQGNKLSEISNRGLTSFANSYLAGNPELIEQAAETVRNDPIFRTLAKSYERKRKGNR
jgi:hypothetical protein